MYIVSIPSLCVDERKYETILKVKVADVWKLVRLIQLQRANAPKCLLLRTADAKSMYGIVRPAGRQKFDIFFACNEAKLELCMRKVEFKVEDVIKFVHLESNSADVEYPMWQKYFIFGNETEAYLAHAITKAPDFFQVLCPYLQTIIYSGHCLKVQG